MGFRFHNLNPLYRTCITKLSRSQENFHPNPIIQTLNSHLQDPSLSPSEIPVFKIPRRWHFGHSHHGHDHDHHHKHHNSGEEGEQIFRLGLAADIGLATGKALTGYLSGSTAIIADAAHSVSDVVTKFSGFSFFLFNLLNHVVCSVELCRFLLFRGCQWCMLYWIMGIDVFCLKKLWELANKYRCVWLWCLFS